MVAATQRKFAGLLAVATLTLTPIAILKPALRIPFEDWMQAAVAVALRPMSLFGSVDAGSPFEATADEVAAVRALRAALRADVAGSHEGLLQVDVLGCEGRGGGGLPSILVLDRAVDRDEADELAGRPVVVGEDLCGFVQPPLADFDGLLRVELLNWLPPRRSSRMRRRVVALASSVVDKDAHDLRVIVEAARTRDPRPIRVALAVPRHLDTWSDGVAPFLARTVASELLHAEVPGGLRLGFIESVGYASRSFVLRRWIVPVWDPRSIVRVGIVGAAHFRRANGVDGLPAAHRARVSITWSSPSDLAYRRYLLRGPGVVAGAAVVRGMSCLGRVLLARAGIGIAEPLGTRGLVLPVVYRAHAGGAPRALVLRGLGMTAKGAEFSVEHPADLEDGELDRGTLFTGVVNSRFPHGLIVGAVTRHAAGRVHVQTSGFAAWNDVSVVRDGAQP